MPVSRQISCKRLINLYKRAGIDVHRFFAGQDRLILEQHPSGLLSWSPSVVGDSQFYADLAERIPYYYPCEKPEYDAALPLIPVGSDVLEVGCGEGRFGSLYASEKWFGVDINHQAIQQAKSRGLRCRVWNFLEDSISDLPRESFSTICSFQMIEHLPNPAHLFSFAQRHLLRDGRLIIGAPAMDSLLGKNPMSVLNLPPHHQTWWTDAALRRYPEQFGFFCEDIIHVPLDYAHHSAFVTLLLRDLLARRVSHLPAPISGLIRSMFAKPLALFSRLLVKEGSIDAVFGARGQSVLAVYRKANCQDSTLSSCLENS